MAKRKIKNILCDKKLHIVLMVLVLFIALIPILRMALYTAPWYDDYMYTIQVRDRYLENGMEGFWSGVIYKVTNTYFTWQGTFSSIFFMAISPLTFGERYYCLGVVMVITFAAIAPFLFFRSLLKNIFLMDLYSASKAGLIASFVVVEFIYSFHEGVFWYNSAVHYTFMHSILLILLALVIELVHADKTASRIVLTVLSLLFAVLCSGANFVTTLQGLLGLLVVMIIGLIRRKKQSIWIVPCVCLYIIGFVLNVIAPGNDVRAEGFVGLGAIESILMSFKASGEWVLQFSSTMQYAVMLLMVPIAVNASKGNAFSYRLPGLITILSYCFYATGFTSSYYAMGAGPVPRTAVAIKITYQVVVIINIFYWVGYLTRKARNKIVIKQSAQIAYVAVLAMIMIGAFLYSPFRAGECLSYGSYFFLHNNSAQSFREQYLERIETVKNSDEDILELEPITIRPVFLIGNNELSKDPSDHINRVFAEYYGKSEIMLKEY